MSKNKQNEPSTLGKPTDIFSPYKSKIALSQLNNFVSDLEGKILTVIDASITEQKQREAVKSLVRQYVWSDFDKVRDWYYSQTDEQVSSFPFSQGIDTKL